MNRLAAAAIAALLGLTPRVAEAGASARLAYVRGAGAESCPGEAAVRAAVTARLGYDPFFAWAHDTLVLEITRSDGAYRAAIKLVDDDSRLRGARDFAIKGDDCGAVIDAAALTISLTIDPSSIIGAPVSDPAPPPRESPAQPAQPPVVVAQPTPGERPRVAPVGAGTLRAHVGVGAFGSLGAEPSGSAGATIFVGVSWLLASLDLEGRADLPATTPSDGSTSRVQAYLLAGSIIPCLHLDIAFGCPVLSVGRLDATSVGTTSPREAWDTWVSAGGRAGVELTLSRDWLFRAYGELLGTVRRETLLIGGAQAYAFPPASGGLGMALAWRFQ